MEKKKIRILIVDDSKMMRSMIKKNCVMDGYTKIDMATNGKEALEMLQQKKYHLVTLDVAMPVMDGSEFLEILRQFEEFNDILVMMITAEADRELILKFIELGANEYIVKPFSTETFQRKVGHMLAHRNRTKEEIMADLDNEKKEHENLLSQVKDHLASSSSKDNDGSRAKFCPKCGTKALENSNFCHQCGESLAV